MVISTSLYEFMPQYLGRDRSTTGNDVVVISEAMLHADLHRSKLATTF